jgi:hypothetical protein
MASLVEISNFALGEVAEQNIQTLDDATTPAIQCKRFIYQTIREVLSSAKWKCARDEAELAQDATAPLFGWEYSYNLPSDFLRIVSFNDVDPDNVVEELFEVRGRRLVTDEATCNIIYIKDMTLDGSTGAMPPLMVKAVYLSLAAKLAWSIQQNRTLKEGLENAAEVSLRKAKSADAREEIRPLVNRATQSNWLQGRYSSTNG